MPKRKAQSKVQRTAQARRRRTLSLAQVPNDATVREFGATADAYPNVVGSFIGAKTTKGKRTRTPALVCLVEHKYRPRERKRPRSVLPRAFEWLGQRSTVKELPTDVMPVQGGFRRAAMTLGPGDVAGDRPRATVGYAMRHPEYGDVLTTAGHLLLGGRGDLTFSPDSAPVVTLSNGDGNGQTTGRVLRAICDELRDYALIQPLAGQNCRNLYDDRYLIRQPHRAFEGDLERPVQVLSAGGVRNSVLRGVRGRIRVDASRVMQDLLLADYNTIEGDSGASLIDEFGRTIGLLVGAFVIDDQTYSVFAPADVPLWSEGGAFL